MPERLSPDGAIIYNLFGSMRASAASHSGASTTRCLSVWDNVWLFRLERCGSEPEQGGQHIVLATDAPLSTEQLLAGIASRADGLISVPGFELLAEDLYTEEGSISMMPPSHTIPSRLVVSGRRGTRATEHVVSALGAWDAVSQHVGDGTPGYRRSPGDPSSSRCVASAAGCRFSRSTCTARPRGPSEPVGELPDKRSVLGRYIWRRQVESLAEGPRPESARLS